MMQSIQRYLFSLVCAALLCALALSLLPKGAVRRVVGIGCALLLAVAALSPLAALDAQSIASALSRVRMDAEAARTGVTVQNRALVCAIIKQKTEAYILDKAAQLGLDIRAEVTVTDSGAYPFPSAVTLTGYAAPQQKQALSQCIAEELAIGEEAQTWRTN